MVENVQNSSLQKTTTLLSSLNSGKTSDKSSGGLSGLLSGLNMDQLNLSDDARQKVLWAKSQFELNYQVIRSMNTSQGLTTSEETFSFKGSYEFLQKVSGQETSSAPQDQTTKAPGTQETQAQDQTSSDLLTQLQDYFSPEKTAERILDVATSFFAVSETGQTQGNTQTARQTFADFIGNAIEEGFKQARGILGQLPETIETGINKTHSLVFSGLEDFVKNGINPEKLTSGGVMEKIAAYRQEAAQKSELLETSTGVVSYSSKGDLQSPSPDASTISTKG